MFTFAAVLVLVTGLLVGLFSGAGAVDMFFDDHDGEVSGQETFTVNIEVPDDETVPIASLEAILEQQGEDSEDKSGSIVDTRESCTMIGAGTDCSFESAISRIQVAGFLAGGDPVDEAYVFVQDEDRSASRTGYGYDDTGSNMGYGYQTGDTTSIDMGPGEGYGYDGASMTIQVEVTVDAGQLDAGDTYYLTLLADSGHESLGILSSPFTEFSVSSAGGGGGGLPGGTTDGALVVTPGESFDGEAGDTVRVTGLGAGFGELGLTLSQDCTGCSISFETHTSRPGDTPDPSDSGFDDFRWFTIDVLDSNGDVIEGYVDEGYLEFEVDQDDLDESPQQVVLLHEINPWEPEPTDLESDEDADPLEFNATISGFSEFALATDEEGPEVTNTEPTGEISAATPEISADFEDNRGIDTDSFELTVNGDTVESADGSLTVTEDGFTYVPASSLGEDSHEVEASVQDESGLETTEAWSFQVQDIECDPVPAIVDISPADGATDVALTESIAATVEEGECAILESTVTVNGEEVDATYEDGELEADLPEGVGADETVEVSATVIDEGDNAAERSWSFTTTDSPDDEPAPGPEDGGLSPLAWTIIALVVLAVIGVAAYFYTQGGPE